MRCLSVRQPWASLLVTGGKRLETRSWRTRHRGPLAIHAAQQFPGPVRALCGQEPFRSALLRAGIHDPADLPRGKVVGYGELVGCVATQQLVAAGFAGERAEERCFGDYRPGRWAWALVHPIALAVPQDYRGQRGLFEVPDTFFLASGGCKPPDLFTAQGVYTPRSPHPR
ncbi:MAG TPA: ASCH domain-containing protein [Gemmataceae bacterium]|nr:ASCH domain-containing protein [Gemmataceae bacterium]